MCFREVELSFNENHKIIGVLGRYEYTDGKSNRAGKSALLESILYLLYGQSRVGSRGHKKLVNREGKKDKEGFVIQGTWILSDGSSFQIERTRDYQGKSPTVVVSGYEGAGVEEANQAIVDTLGFTYEETSNTCWFKQGDIHTFMESKPADKRALLLEWLNQHRWDRYYKVADDEYKKFQGELNAVDIALQSLDVDATQEDTQKLSNVVEKCENVIAELTDRVDYWNNELKQIRENIRHTEEQLRLKEDLIKLQQEIEDIEGLLTEAIDTQGKLRELQRKNEKLEGEKEKTVKKYDKEIKVLEVERESKEIAYSKKAEQGKQESLDGLQQEIDECTNEYYSVHGDLSKREHEVFLEVKNLGTQIENIRTHNGNCPVLKEPCDRIEPNDNDVHKLKDLEEKKKVLKDKIEKTYQEKEETLRDLENQKEYVKKKFEDEQTLFLESLAQEYSEKIYKIEKKRKEYLTEYNTKSREIKQEIGELPDAPVGFYEEKLEKLEQELVQKNDRLNAYIDLDCLQKQEGKTTKYFNRIISALNKVKNKVAVYKERLSKLQEQQEKLDRLQKDREKYSRKMAEYNYCRYMFSSRGIPQEFIKNSFQQLEEDINYILDRVDSNLEIEFKPYKVGNSFEKGCLVCGYEFSGRQRKCKECSSPREKKKTDSIVLNVLDKAEGNVSEFDLDSGGGKTLISFAVRLSLLFLKLRENNVEPLPIVLDEIAGALDPVNRSAIMYVVLQVLTEEFNIPQIFWISHEDDIQEALDTNLIVTRHDKHSTVNWG